MKRSGFTLLESLITVLIMGGLVAIVFVVFSVGVSGFKLGTNRLDLQGELRRVLTPLRKDLKNSTFQSVSVAAISTVVPEKPPAAAPTVSVQRDGICMNGLLDIQSNASYQTGTGLPIWDCYVCYFATLDSPDGKFIRLVLRDTAPGTLGVALPLAGSDLTTSNPRLVTGSMKTLSAQILEFGASVDNSNQLVRLSLKLRSKQGHLEMGGRSTVEVLEIQTTVDPANTNPRL